MDSSNLTANFAGPPEFRRRPGRGSGQTAQGLAREAVREQLRDARGDPGSRIPNPGFQRMMAWESGSGVGNRPLGIPLRLRRGRGRMAIPHGLLASEGSAWAFDPGPIAITS